jgi:PST family polysaccharide transporter
MSDLGAKLAPSKPGARISVLAWSGLESTCRQLLSLLFFFGTVRFLAPSDLGVFSLGLALSGIFCIVIDEPIGEALVQQHSTTTSDWDTGYTINIAIAGLCFLLACGASPVLASLLREPLLKFVIPALALSSFIGATGNIHKALLSRSLKFRTIAQTALLAQLVGGIISLGAAAAGLGYWALILNVLGAATVTSVAYRLVSSWKPRLRIDTNIVRARASYVGCSVAIRSLYLLRDQSLFVVAGTLGDLKTVGYLSLAMRVARSLAQLFEEVTSRPLISLISRQQNDLTRFGEVLQTVLHIIGLVAFPSFIGLAELGTPVLSTLIGSQWAPAGHYLPWICAGMSGWLFLHVVAVALRARGLGRLAVYLTAPSIFVDVGIFASAAVIGLDSALMVWAARALLTLPVLVSMLATRLGLSVQSLVRIWMAPVSASVLMLLCLRWLERGPLAEQGALGLLKLIATGAAVYGLALLTLSWQSTRGKPLLWGFRR